MKKRETLFLVTSLSIVSLLTLFVLKEKMNVDERPITIVAFGDSLTEGYGVAPSDTYPAQLENLLKERGFPNLTIYNKGYSGDTSYDGLRKVDEVLALKPQIVLLAFGPNDAMRRVPPALIKDNLSLIVRKLQSNGIVVVMEGFKVPLEVGGEYGSDFESIFQDMAKSMSLIYVPNLLDGVAFRANLVQKDALHPNKDGYSIVAKRTVLPYAMRAIKEASFVQK